MKKEVFDKEISMCKYLSKKNSGKCNWGECDKCGVIPLLFKLQKGKMHENKDDIVELKNKILPRK